MITRRVGPWALVALLAGCSVLPAKETVVTYTLPWAEAPAVAAVPASDAVVLKVSEPRASRLLSSLRILVRPTGNELSVYQGVRWSDPPPVLIRDLLVERLRATQALAAVTSDPDLPAPLVLGTELAVFEAVYEPGHAAPVVHVRLDATLVQWRNRRIVATQRFEARAPASSTAVADVVTAFGRAADQVGAAAVTWTVTQASQWRLAQGQASPTP